MATINDYYSDFEKSLEGLKDRLSRVEAELRSLDGYKITENIYLKYKPESLVMKVVTTSFGEQVSDEEMFKIVAHIPEPDCGVFFHNYEQADFCIWSSMIAACGPNTNVLFRQFSREVKFRDASTVIEYIRVMVAALKIINK